MKRWLIGVLCLGAALIMSIGSAEALQYKMVDLGLITNNAVRSINDNGQILAKSDQYGYCVWQDGRILESNLPFSAVAMNNKGQIVGKTYESMLLWDNGNTIEICSNGNCSAYGMNNNGQVVGTIGVFSIPYELHACVWTGGNSTDLGTFGGTNSGAVDINDSGLIVGYSYYPTTNQQNIHACMWTSAGAKDLGTLGGNESMAYAINNNGAIAGYSYAKTYGTHAVMWCDDKIIDLDKYGYSKASDINDSGLIVGESKASDGYTHATLWQDGNMIQLEDLGYGSSAMKINNNGWIIGRTSDASGNYHSALWEPVPEPSSILALLCGIGGLAGVIRKRS